MMPLISMWKHPKMVAWTFAGAVFLLVVRGVFARAQMIPYFIEFQPFVILIPLLAAYYGPAGVWAVAISILLGDLWLGMWGEATAFRTCSAVLFALFSMRVWCRWQRHFATWSEHTPLREYWMRICLIAAVGCFVLSVWSGLAAEHLKLYPFPYVASLVLGTTIVFSMIMAPLCTGVFLNRFVKRTGTWFDVMRYNPLHGAISMTGLTLLLCGSIGAYFGGLFAAGIFYGFWPTHSAVLGLPAGKGVIAVVAPLLLLQIIGVCLPYRRKNRRTASA